MINLTSMMFLNSLGVNYRILIFLFYVLFLTFPLLYVFFSELYTTTHNLRSKHSCEHKVIEFVLKNKRLPQTINELKKTTRFTIDCGCKQRVVGFSDIYIMIIVSFIIAFGVALLVDTYVGYWVVMDLLFGLFFIILLFSLNLTLIFGLSPKFKKLSSSLNKYFIYFIELANTTSKPREIDYFVAYYAAKVWVISLHPEFYDSQEDTFLDNESETISKLDFKLIKLL